MPIVRKLKVYSPVTRDGINPIMEQVPGERGMLPKERISYVGLAAKKEIDRLNERRPIIFRERYEEVEYNTKTGKEVVRQASAKQPATFDPEYQQFLEWKKAQEQAKIAPASQAIPVKDEEGEDLFSTDDEPATISGDQPVKRGRRKAN